MNVVTCETCHAIVNQDNIDAHNDWHTTLLNLINNR